MVYYSFSKLLNTKLLDSELVQCAWVKIWKENLQHEYTYAQINPPLQGAAETFWLGSVPCSLYTASDFLILLDLRCGFFPRSDAVEGDVVRVGVGGDTIREAASIISKSAVRLRLTLPKHVKINWDCNKLPKANPKDILSPSHQYSSIERVT